MTDNRSFIKDGYCVECGAKSIDDKTCIEMFHAPLTWEHNDPNLYELHFWLVACYMLQHPSNMSKEGYSALKNLFVTSYDGEWPTSYILKMNRELTRNIKIATSISYQEREYELKQWKYTISDIYDGGEKSAITNIKLWKEEIRREL